MVTVLESLPQDAHDAILIGRISTPAGPTPVSILDGQVFDLSDFAPTVADVIAMTPPGRALPEGHHLGPIDMIESRPAWEADAQRLLAPIDLQCIKAAGVTFAVSALERVIEERARGDVASAHLFRDEIQARIGGDIFAIRPGSPEAEALKAALIESGSWSQYLEVAIGPDAEVFTKAPVLSAVGSGAYIGIRSDSHWNNPEPEIVIVADPAGNARGATLGNDVNLRDFEGRSALLLGKAKDNNASCALGPFIRLFDDNFTIDDVRSAEVSLHVAGEDGYRLDGSSSMRLISRDPLELIRQTMKSHQYPDGFVLFLGTMFAPIDDRCEAGRGFTHKVGDVVTVSTPRLGALTNKVRHCEDAPPWTFGISDLMRNLAGRGLLGA